MFVINILIPLVDVLKDLQVGGDDVLRRYTRKAPQFSNEHLSINISVISFKQAVFSKICAKGLIIRRLLRNL